MQIKWDPTINLSTLLIGIPILIVMLKAYGDWRQLVFKIQLMWQDYIIRHDYKGPERREEFRPLS